MKLGWTVFTLSCLLFTGCNLFQQEYIDVWHVGDKPETLDISADGRFLLVGSHQSKVVGVSDWQVVCTLPGEYPIWDKANQNIYHVEQDSYQITRYKLDFEQQPVCEKVGSFSLNESGDPIRQISISADGDRVAVAYRGETIVLGSPLTETALCEIHGGERAVFDPTGTDVFAIVPLDNQTDIKRFDSTTCQELAHIWTSPEGLIPYELAFSPDGSRLICPTFSGHTLFIDPTSGKIVVDLIGNGRGDSGGPNHVSSVDGQFFINNNGSNEIGVWRLEDQQLMHIYRGHTDFITGLELSPDESYLYSGGADETIRVWPVDWQ